jgi:two-component system chemotaxis response regulator CheY
MDVLIVDDSSAIRKILQRVLQQTDIAIGSIHEAADGVQALAVLKDKTIGLIFSDINMPNMDGLQLLGELRASSVWKTIPVLMITTEGSQSRVLEALDLGASGYVRKPFTLDQIKDKLVELL